MQNALSSSAIKYRNLLRISFLAVFLYLIPSLVEAQEKANAFFIALKSKEITDQEAVPLSERAMKRRLRYGIAIDSTDFPVNQDLINTICADSNIRFRYSLKWHNALVVDSYKEDLSDLIAYPFVKSISYLGKTAPAIEPEGIRSYPLEGKEETSEKQFSAPQKADYGESYTQNRQIGATIMHQLGYDGKGIFIAVFDAGFFNADLIPAYKNLRADSKLISGYDLVDLDNMLVDTDKHGTSVSSCMASYDSGKYIGSAPGASYILFRTENSSSEFLLEELNWCKAAELSDSAGVDLISSSLGYTRFDDATMNHSYNELNGRNSFVSLAARYLDQKGVLVVNSAGNDGSKSWKKIGTPADVPEILTIGAVDRNGNIASFSSIGIGKTGIVKPDICALGVKTAVSSTYGSYYRGNGTSYAAPLAAGGIACLLQAFPEKSPSQIKEAIRKSASHNRIPDSIYGYGLLNLQAAMIYLQELESGFSSAPRIIDSGTQLLIFNGNYTEIEFSLYEDRRFLFFFKRHKKVSTIQIETDLPFSYIRPKQKRISCTEKYTLRLLFKGAVGNYKITRKDFYFCEG